MVENIYGRKTYPQTKYHERAFLQSYALTVHHRRVSGEPPNPLRTIAESDGDDDDLPSQSVALPPVQSDLEATGRKPRAISLPTIYRDGSYLRINFPAQLRNEGSGRRRFSEPAVSWNSKFRPAIVPVSSDKKVTNDKLPRISQTRDISLCSGGVSHALPQKIQVEKRRHSDPVIYSSEIIQKFENLKSDSQTNNHDTKPRNDLGNSSASCDEKSNDESRQRPENVTSAAPTRRRKSSLVPIPFSIVKSCSSRKPKTPSKRRLSFPLSKNEEELTKNLPTFHKLAWIAGNDEDHHYSSSSESLKSVDLLIRKDSLGELDLPEEDDMIPEKKHSCEEIITQWMKFFG